MSIFFYDGIGDTMKIYIDVIFLINIFFDFLLLLSVSLILRRRANIFKIILGSLVGASSILFLFFNISTTTLFFLKIIIALLMVLTTFGYKNIRYTLKNISFLYLTSIALGGALYFFNIEFSYKNEGIIFYHNGMSINLIILLIISPILIYIYVKEIKSIRNNYSKYHKVDIYFKSNKNVLLTGYMDTGNNLTDPYKGRPIVLVNYKKIKKYVSDEKELLVPFNSVNNDSIMKCIRISKIIVDGKTIKNVLLGISTNDICIDGVDCILNNKMEDLCLEN